MLMLMLMMMIAVVSDQISFGVAGFIKGSRKTFVIGAIR
jgi:hypothetical protein